MIRLEIKTVRIFHVLVVTVLVLRFARNLFWSPNKLASLEMFVCRQAWLSNILKVFKTLVCIMNSLLSTEKRLVQLYKKCFTQNLS